MNTDKRGSDNTILDSIDSGHMAKKVRPKTISCQVVLIRVYPRSSVADFALDFRLR